MSQIKAQLPICILNPSIERCQLNTKSPEIIHILRHSPFVCTSCSVLGAFWHLHSHDHTEMRFHSSVFAGLHHTVCHISSLLWALNTRVLPTQSLNQRPWSLASAYIHFRYMGSLNVLTFPKTIQIYFFGLTLAKSALTYRRLDD